MTRLPFADSASNRRIVVTGLGVVSPLACNVDDFWRGLCTTADANTAPADHAYGIARFSGHIDDFGELPSETRKTIRKALKLMNRETQMGVAAGQQALTESQLLSAYDSERIGVCFGADNVSILPEDFRSGVEACLDEHGELDLGRWGEDGLPEVAPLWLLKCLPNMPACHLAIINDLRGPGNTITQRDVAANMAVAEAVRILRSGDADAMVVGGTGTTLETFNRMRAELEGEVHPGGDSTVCRPFDLHRTGAAAGEGAAAVVLEDYTTAIRRGAPIYGEILAATSATAIGHDGAAACGKALSRSIRLALKRSLLPADAVGHIHAHGLSTRQSDITEAESIRDVLGSFASQTPVTCSKGHLANAGAGAGALELVASLLAMQHNCTFPVRHLTDLDPACPIRPVVDHQTPAGDTFLNLSMFGRGLASCVAVARC